MSKKLRKLIIIAITTATIMSSAVTLVFAQSNTFDEFKSEVLTHMQNRETAFIINYTGDSTEFGKQVNTLIKEASASDEYLSLSWVKQGGTVSGVNGNLNVSLTMSYLTTKEQEVIVDQKVDEIVSQVVTSGMTVEQKLKALHDYVCSITSYDFTLQKNSAYTALIDGQTICRGYTLLLYKLYDKIGIPTHIVLGTLNGTSHSWNMVQVDGKWYHVDATNDDANNTTKYYMISDTDLINYGFVWIKSDYPSTSDEGTVTPPNTQQLIQATDAMVTAEGSLTLADKVIAETLINALPTGTDKIALIERLTVLKQTLNLNSATTSVILAEATPTQNNINLANQAIALLPTGNDKTELQQRITAILNTIIHQNLQTATEAVIKAETSMLLVDINSAQTIINSLPTGTDKTTLISRLDIVKKYLASTNLVVTAEKVISQATVDTAINSVKLLPDGSVKTALQERLQILQEMMANANLTNSTNAVSKAETSLLTTDVANAQKLVNTLVDGVDKTTLQDRLNEVSKKVLENAINAVVKAETSLILADKSNADKLVNGLPTGTDKTSLTSRLKTVNEYIATTNLVVTAEKNKTQASVSTANKAVSLLPDGSLKTALQGRLQTLQVIIDNVNLINSTNAVNKAQTSLLTTDVVNAQKLVAMLLDGTDKTKLQNKLTTITQQILENATNAVVKAETSLILVDKVNADKLVNGLPTGTDKTDLTLRLKTVNQYISTINLVVTAEKVKTQVSVNTAIKSVNLLPDGSLKTELQERLQTVQAIIDNTNLANSTNAVKKAETSLLTTDVVNAQKLVAILIDGVDKTVLQNKLTTITQQILENATNAVVKAETSLILVDKVNADKLVNGLPTGTDKTSLTSRLKTVNEYIATINLVVTAEKNKTQAPVSTATKSVNLLPDGSLKTELQGRLQIVQTIIDNINLTNSTNAVTKAEASLLTTDVVNAQKLATVLVDGADKTALQNRLNAVSKKILENATNAVVKAETSLILADKSNADKLVNGLPTGTDKTSLTSRLKTVNQYIDTIKLVVIAEKTISQATVDTANKSINLLIDGSVKTSLKQRLKAVQIVVN